MRELFPTCVSPTMMILSKQNRSSPPEPYICLIYLIKFCVMQQNSMQHSRRAGNDSPQVVPINLLDSEPHKSIEICESILRYQNTCLATRIDYQKKLMSDQRKLISELQDREYRYQAFFKNIYVSWTSFLSRNQRIHQMLKRSGDCKLEGKFTSAFSHLDQIFMSQSMLDDNSSRQISGKFITFLKMIENIYMEISTEYDQWVDRVLKDTDATDVDNEYLRTLVKQCKEILAKGKELESAFKLKIQLREKKVNDLDVQFGHQSIFRIQQLLSESRRENMHLTRRVRLLTEYNYKNIKHKVDEASEQGINEIQGLDENYECVCGAAQVVAYKQLLEPQQQHFIGSAIEGEEMLRPALIPDSMQINSIHCNVNHLNQMIQKAIRSRTAKVERSEEGAYQLPLLQNELKDLENVLNSYYSTQSKCELLQVQNRKLSDSLVRYHEQIKGLELKLSSNQEQFFQSDLYHFLSQHNRHLNDVNSLLTNQIRELQVELHDSFHSRQVEISSLRHQYENEISRLSIETARLRQELQDKRTHDLQHFTGIDIEQFCEGLKARNSQLQKVVDSQMHELQSQRQQLQQSREKIETAEKKIGEYSTKLNILEQNVTVLQSKLPEEFKLENYQFRHQKHKDFILELNNHILAIAPQFKDKYAELCAYLKSRDQRVADLEKKINQIQEHEIKQLKRQQELMLTESEINQKTYIEIQKNSKLVEQQLCKQIKESSEARIIQEKIAEKAQNDSEKAGLLSKWRSAEELIRKLTTTNQDLQTMVTNIQGQKGKQEDFNYRDQEFKEDLRKQTEQLITQREVLILENQTLREKTQNADLLNGTVLKELELSTQRILELEEIIKQQEELINSPKLLEQMKGYIVLKSTDQNNNMIEIKEVASCSDCNLNFKEVFIWKCAHMICKDCGEKAVFKEQCPVCKIRIDIGDIWKAKMVPN